MVKVMIDIQLNSKPLISVIVPVYNVEDYIDECIESIISQTYSKLEIIIVNDGSKDRSREKCEKYVGLDNRIRIIDKSNGGLSSARNAGIKVATGDYLCFIDSDDYIENTMIESLLRVSQMEQADIVCCNYDNVNEKSGTISKHNIRFQGIEKYNRQEAHELMLAEDFFKCFAWNKLYKKELFDNIQYPEGLHYEDILTLYKLIKKANTIVFTSEPLYHYRVRENSITRSFFTDKEYELLIPIRYIMNENKNNEKILTGCCVYYIYFLDDMILGNRWDKEVYREYCELYDKIKNYLKVDEIYGEARKKQMMICRSWLSGYRILYKVINKAGGHK